MQLDADELLARIRQDYPDAYEYCRLVLLVEKQAAEIERLNLLIQQPYTGTAATTTVLPFMTNPERESEGRHG